MSKPRNRTSLLSSHNRTSYNSSKDELLAMKYTMDKPDLALYPLTDLTTTEEFEITYPDFKPWKDHTHLTGIQKEQEISKMNNGSFLNKGYFEAPQVTNEYYSARNLIQATVFSSTENCNLLLGELSQHLANAYKTRNEVINKIKYESNNFKIPNRVTLTASKKDNWLSDLANVNIPLVKIGEKIPHGIRNKLLIDAVCSRNVPINRALWFTKCVLFSELLALRRKNHTRLSNGPIPSEFNTVEKFEIHWLQEWTQQVCDYIYKFSREMNGIVTLDKKEKYMNKLAYLLTYVQSLYVECLVDKTYFLSMVFKSLKDGLPLENKHLNELLYDEDEEKSETWINNIDLNYGQRLVSLTLVKIFWKDILKTDYLCKELSELLLLNYLFITRVNLHQKVLPETLTENIIEMISNTVIYLFQYNTNSFIIPNYWIILQDSLVRIMLTYGESQNETDQDNIKTQLELIKYRNESLILNLKHNKSKSGTDDIIMNRDTNDLLHILHCLDKLKLNNELASLLKPTSRKTGCINWRINLKLVLFWCITPYRNHGNSNEGILIVCNFLKKLILQSLHGNVRTEFEQEILEIIYQVPDEIIPDRYNLYVLINELYQLKIITIASYLRKLIASGVFLVPDIDVTPVMKLHLDILQSLPVLNNRQCDNILKKWTTGFNFKEKFHKGQEVLQKEILDKIVNNSFTTMDLSYIETLNVGIKFLLVNWITTELKSTLNDSPKLIHFDPVVLANLYKFYSICDNLTVFFRVLIKTVLKNEGGMIIFYLDSLYFMSKLIKHHFKLIKSLPGDLTSTTTGYELFKLIVLTYKDLQQREYSWFKFNKIWIFIDGVIEKDYEKVEIPKIFSKETMETPMNINTVDTNGKSSGYTSNDFRNDLAVLCSGKGNVLSSGEIQEALDVLKLDITEISPSECVNYYLEYLKSTTTSDQENLIVKLLFSSRVTCEGFNELVKQFMNNVIDSDDQDEIKVKFLRKLIIFEILNINELPHSLLIQVISGDYDLPPNQQLMLQIFQDRFREKHLHQFITIISEEILLSPKSIAKYKQHIIHGLIVNPKLVYESLFDKLSRDDCISGLNILLGTNHIDKLSDFNKLSSDINEFNLPIVQILLKVINSEQDRQELQGLVDTLVNSCQFKFSQSNSFFGELFNFMSWNQKIIILDIIETKFLTGNTSETELLLFNDFFNKFSTNILECTNEFFNNLRSFLTRLINLEFENTSIMISILLRILIIHNSTLCKLISTGQETHIQFIKDLLTLLQWENLEDKLCILLYDLLLLMKSSITQEITYDEATSPTTQPKENEVNIHSIQHVFDLPEQQQKDNPFNIDEQLISSAIMLDEDELDHGGDVHAFNDCGLVILRSRPDSFGILSERSNETVKSVKFKSFEILEDTGIGLNDGCVNLHLLDAYTTRENPP